MEKKGGEKRRSKKKGPGPKVVVLKTLKTKASVAMDRAQGQIDKLDRSEEPERSEELPYHTTFNGFYL